LKNKKKSLLRGNNTLIVPRAVFDTTNYIMFLKNAAILKENKNKSQRTKLCEKKFSKDNEIAHWKFNALKLKE
jgi:hypothetical protein